ncbi:MAG: Flp family type IVb pilin [Acidimicrobiales bacterium]
MNTLLMKLRVRLVDRRSERGASLVEYGLLVALIAVVCVVAVAYFGGATSTSFSTTASEITNAGA